VGKEKMSSFGIREKEGVMEEISGVSSRVYQYLFG
jgi:hypothetical protein